MKSGQRVFVPTREQRNRVAELVAADCEEHLIAADLGISKTILRKHFRDELADGKAITRKRAMTELFRQAFKQGSIPALKTVVALTTDTKVVDQDGKAEAKRPALKLGKKELQQIEADQANKGLYATPAPPKAVKSTLQ